MRTEKHRCRTSLTRCHSEPVRRLAWESVSPSPASLAGGARGGNARLESDQMSRKALPCKACVERSDYFRAARRHKNNGIISGCRKKPEAFSRISSRLFFVRSARGFLFGSAIKRSCVKHHICTVRILQESSTNCKSKLPACKNTTDAL